MYLEQPCFYFQKLEREGRNRNKESFVHIADVKEIRKMQITETVNAVSALEGIGNMLMCLQTKGGPQYVQTTQKYLQ